MPSLWLQARMRRHQRDDAALSNPPACVISLVARKAIDTMRAESETRRVSHGLQLQSLWRIHTAAASLHVFGRAAGPRVSGDRRRPEPHERRAGEDRPEDAGAAVACSRSPCGEPLIAAASQHVFGRPADAASAPGGDAASAGRGGRAVTSGAEPAGDHAAVVGDGAQERARRGGPRPAAAIPVDNPYCSCKLTRVRSRCSSTPSSGTSRAKETSTRASTRRGCGSCWTSDGR